MSVWKFRCADSFCGTFLKAQEIRQAINSLKQTKIMLVQARD
jgi:hypothetical protein